MTSTKNFPGERYGSEKEEREGGISTRQAAENGGG